MEKLSDLIKGRLDKHNLSVSAKSAEVLYNANKFLSGLFKVQNGCVKAYRFEGGVLYIAAENAVLCQELWGAQESLINKLKKQFGDNMIKKIRIKSLTID